MSGPEIALGLGGGLRRAKSAIASAAALGCLLGGCSDSVGSLSSNLTTSSTVASYQPSSLFSQNGYNVSTNADGSLHITAGGSPATPASRLEKIALARAGEYGDEQHLKMFTATPPQTTISCGKSKATFKGERVQIHPTDNRIVSIDVTYSNDTSDTRARRSRDTADALKAELASETVPPEEQAAAAQEVAQHCGR